MKNILKVLNDKKTKYLENEILEFLNPNNLKKINTIILNDLKNSYFYKNNDEFKLYLNNPLKPNYDFFKKMQDLKKFVSNNNNYIPERKQIIDEETKLGKWISMYTSKQSPSEEKRIIVKNYLKDKTNKRLEEEKKHWESMFKKLEIFIEKNKGFLPSSNRYVDKEELALFTWMGKYSQKKSKKNKDLVKKVRDLIEGKECRKIRIDYISDEIMLDKLNKFVEENKHLPSMQYGKQLHVWMYNTEQRTSPESLFVRNEISKIKLNYSKKEDIQKNIDFEKNFNKLKNYYKKNGYIPSLLDSKNNKLETDLAKWLLKYKKEGKLKDNDQVEKVQSFLIDKQTKYEFFDDKLFDEKFKYLKIFIEKNKRLPFRTEKNELEYEMALFYSEYYFDSQNSGFNPKKINKIKELVNSFDSLDTNKDLDFLEVFDRLKKYIKKKNELPKYIKKPKLEIERESKRLYNWLLDISLNVKKVVKTEYQKKVLEYVINLKENNGLEISDKTFERLNNMLNKLNEIKTNKNKIEANKNKISDFEF